MSTANAQQLLSQLLADIGDELGFGYVDTLEKGASASLAAELRAEGITVDDSWKLIKGTASTDDIDLDGEVVRQDGQTWRENAPLILEHPRGVLNVVGHVLKIEKSDRGGRAVTDFVGALYTKSHDPTEKAIGLKVWEAAVRLAKGNSPIKLGVSIEGSPDLRDPANRKVITKSTVKALAITLEPRNPDAKWDPIMKGRASEVWKSVFGTVGTPQQGVNYTGGDGESGSYAPMVPQVAQVSMTHKRRRLLEGLSDDDLAVVQMLKKAPMVPLSWVAACGHYRRHRGGAA